MKVSLNLLIFIVICIIINIYKRNMLKKALDVDQCNEAKYLCTMPIQFR